jgi:cellulose synthase/poly-beta-1,6-N-acetylglucosamine synthase-like glycosyltransferase
MSPLLIIAIALSALYLFLVLYFCIGWWRMKKQEYAEANDLPFVSIIIPVRNESENIQACLKAALAQQYPKNRFEVILIDDYSTDPTLRLAREFTDSNLLVLDLMQYLGSFGEYVPNKKKAIALGVKNAKGDLILTTDGDCVMEDKWLMTMAQFYINNNYKLVTGPVMIKPAKSPLAWFQQLDVMNMLGITGATIQNGLPTMCNGANLMYAKEVFHVVEGFKGNHEVPTGDDIFLMQKINAAYDNAIGFVKNFDACVFTQPEPTFGEFVAQRVRWVSKSSRFSDIKVVSILYFAYLFNLFIVLTALACFQPIEMPWLPLAVAGGTKLFIDLVFDISLLVFFRKWLLFLLLPITEVFHILYVVVIGVLSLTGKYRWKDRLVE